VRLGAPVGGWVGWGAVGGRANTDDLGALLFVPRFGAHVAACGCTWCLRLDLQQHFVRRHEGCLCGGGVCGSMRAIKSSGSQAQGGHWQGAGAMIIIV
jgi:hypothetical protein